MTENDVDVKVQVMALVAREKTNEVAFQYPPPQTPFEVAKKQLDTRYVSVQLFFDPIEDRQYCVSMYLKAEDVRKLNLMVGDKLTLKIIKDSQ